MQHTGIVVPLDIANIDTDAIISKQFLKITSRDNFGKYLFGNWRFLDEDYQQLDQNFVLNKPCYKGASILLTRDNFGCGSSREHAVWALVDYGFRVIIAPSFSDIFYINGCNNKMWLINLSVLEIDQLFEKVTTFSGSMLLTIDLISQKIYGQDKIYAFTMKDFDRHCILNDFDHIEYTMTYDPYVIKYESDQLIFLQ